MKRCIIALVILSLTFTACSKSANDTSQAENSTASSVEPTTTVVDSTTSPVEPTTVSGSDKYYSADGIELLIDMRQYSENAKLLTADDIYLLSLVSGYISGDYPDLLIIEDREQLDCALEQYGLALPPEGLSKDELWYYNTAVSEPFNRMADEYPITDYSYVIEYEVVPCGGYDLKVGALLVDEDKLHFVRTADSKTPEPGTAQPDVMGGFCYMAAVPKDTLMNNQYKGWTYPGRGQAHSASSSARV